MCVCGQRQVPASRTCAVNLFRVTAYQRDALLEDVVPQEVADTLLHEFARQQTRGRAREGALGAPARPALRECPASSSMVSMVARQCAK